MSDAVGWPYVIKQWRPEEKSLVQFGLRSLLYDRVRFAISIGAVAFAILLILLLRGIMDGTIARTTVYIERVGADLFVTQSGVKHVALGVPILPAGIEDRVAAVNGVELAAAIVRVPAIVDVGGAPLPTSVVGFDPALGLGGPWLMDEGRTDLSEDGVIVDETVARVEDLALGDEIGISGQRFVIEGISIDTNAMATGRSLFMRRDVAERLFLSAGLSNFVLVRVAAGAEIPRVREAIRQAIPGVEVLSREELAESDERLWRQLFGVPVNVMASAALLVGFAAMGLAIYAAASERATDFGVLKAIGAPNGYLYRIVLQQALLIGLVGFVLGVALARAAGEIIEYVTPELGVEMRFPYVARTFGIAVLLSVVASAIPVRRIAGLDPLRVFTR
jgi:putative ABC transport system permease protein